MSEMRIDVADLLSNLGARRHVDIEASLVGLAESAAKVVGPVRADLSLERIPQGIVVRGEVGVSWHAECSICLGDVDRPLTVHVDELFETEPVEGETYPIEGHQIDLEQLVRDNVLLELPLAPHCETPCEPAGGADAEAEPPSDPRWAALSELEL